MYPDLTSRSAALVERAKRSMPGGNSRLAVWYAPYPVYFASGQGCRVTDVDGVERLDFVNNMTALLHGHCHPKVVEAVGRQATRLMGCSAPTEQEIQLAELLCDRVPSVEQVRFANSGTEAVLFALRAARAYTGRQKIARVEGAYHGSTDAMETSQVVRPAEWGGDHAPVTLIDSVGIPKSVEGDIVTLPNNDADAARRILDAHADDLAGVIIDPFTPRLGFCQASAEFLGAVREFCTRNRTVLIYDEVMTFRSGYRGAQDRVGVLPDLTAMGKVIGGGLPCGGVGGRREFMQVFDQSKGPPIVPHSGTNNANPMVMAAGLATLEAAPQNVYDHLDRLGERLRKGLTEALSVAGITGWVRGVGSLTFMVIGASRAPSDFRGMCRQSMDHEAHGMLHRYLLNHGVISIDSNAFILSSPMQDRDVDFLLEQVLGGLRDLARTSRPQRATA
jgi:glutamate-1-semialdehyde 2,1-aminomutase